MSFLLRQLNGSSRTDRRTVLAATMAALLVPSAVEAFQLNDDHGTESHHGSPTPAAAIASPIPDATPLAAGALRDVLTRTSFTDEGVEFDLLLAPAMYFEATGRSDHIEKTGADKHVVFLIAEHHFEERAGHEGHFLLMPILRLDGKDIHVARKTIELTNDGHHRTTALLFEELPAEMLNEIHTWEMILPEGASGERVALLWATPIEFPTG